MIQLKYFYPGQRDCIVNIGECVSHYEGVGAELINYQHGLKWEYNGRQILLFEKNVRIIGYPSVDMSYVVAVYFGNSRRYPIPNNCVVYNLDGSIHKLITTPLLMTPDDNGRYNKGYCFSNIIWYKKTNNELTLSLIVEEENWSWIPWYEVIEFDPKIGKFGELLGRAVH